MARFRALLISAAVLAVLVGLGWWYARSHVEGVAPIPASNPAKAEKKKAATPAPPVSSDQERSHLADELNSPRSDIRRDLQIVAEVLEAFRTNFPHYGNPVGENDEITAALTGKNKLHLALIPPDHPAINRHGQLCDRWGTPFFFHAESGTRMGIRSAGPDRKMWTADDIALEP